jgi:CRP-like cAMP-binding protein
MTCTDSPSLVQPKRDHPINLLLAALPGQEFERLVPHLEAIELPRGKVLFDQGEKATQVYFPSRAMVSLVAVMKNGAPTEIGIIGREGMVGLPVIWGGDSANYRAIVQIPGDGYRLAADVLKAEFCRRGHLHDLLMLYSQALFTHVSQTAACNAQHSIDKRLARWLLRVQDSTELDRLPLTQEFVAEMLGARRPSISVAAKALQEADIIRYSRGQIVILSRQDLEAKACECYHRVRSEFARLLDF